MLPRVLYVDECFALEMDWLGLGALQVRFREGRVQRAHRIQKLYFVTAASVMEGMGQAMTPSNPSVNRLMQTTAALLADSPVDSTTWQLLLERGPHAMAAACIETANRPAGAPGAAALAMFG